MNPSKNNCHHHRIQVLVALVAIATLGLTQLLSAYASGVFFVAPSGNDANSCLSMASACKTIVAAVSKASAGDTVVIATGVYTEAIGINKNLTLIGFGADATIINQGRIDVTTATVRIYDLAITNGSGDWGGALLNDKGDVTLGHTSILSSHAQYGGGIFNNIGNLSLDDSTIAGNSSVRDGGGIYNNFGNVSISHSTIMSNTACNTACLYISSRSSTGKKPDNGFLSLGGGIANYAHMTIDASSIVSNSSASYGDGIYNGSTLVVTNTTISGNFGSFDGLYNGSVVTSTNVTMSDNAGNLSSFSSARAFLKNTIMANSTNGTDCRGSNIVSLGHNLSSDSTCNLNAAGDLTNTNPLLGPLQNNGGPTPTHALLAGSPAINHGDNAGCPPTDQRGITRPQAGVCDIGAYEYVFPYSMYLPLVMR